MKDHRMHTFGLIILHYLTLEDTESLLEQVYSSDAFHDTLIYVVDNASPDGSGRVLHDTYHGKCRTRVLLLDKNIGFARALNTGITEARRDGCDFVITANSDIVLDLNKEFCATVTTLTEKDSGIALIGPRIVNLDGEDQSPFSLKRPCFNRFKLKLVFTTKIGRVLHFFHFTLYGLLNLLVPCLRLNQMAVKNQDDAYVYALHGCVLIFTPAFFKHLVGFDEGTFLAQEEWIMAEILHQRSLKTFFTRKISICHKEGTSISRANKRSAVRVLMFREKHNYVSRSYLVKKYLL